jgi:hypothetical protein
MKGFKYLVDSKSARISETYADYKSISIDEAMKLFLGSATYRVLNNVETGVYLEVFEFVYDMFLEEMGERFDET